MPGIRIRVSTEDAVTATQKLTGTLDKLGATTKLTSQEIANLQKRMLDKMATDAGQRAFDSVANSIGMTKKEINKFQESLTGTSGLSNVGGILSSAFGRFTGSLAGMAAGLVGATTLVASLNQVFQKGFKAVEDYNTSIASLAAMVMTFTKRQEGMNFDSQWQQALKYSTEMIPILENIAAKTLLSGQETTALANAFARSGVFLDATNKKQVESFTRLSNAIPLMTQGQAIMLQINQEVRSLMSGGNVANSMLLQTLKSIDPLIEKNLKTWRAQGKVLENIGTMLEGFGPATKILENNWMAVKSTIDTTVTQTLRGGMMTVYSDIINAIKSMDGDLQKGQNTVAGGIVVAWELVKDAVLIVWNVIAGLQPILGPIVDLVGMIAYGWGGVLAVLEPISKMVSNILSMGIEVVKVFGNAVLSLGALINLQPEIAKVAANEAINSAKRVKTLAKESVDLFSTGIGNSLEQYSKQVEKAMASNKSTANKYRFDSKIPADDKDAKKAAKEAERIAKDMFNTQTALNKEYYDTAIANADMWLEQERNNGAYEMDLVNQYYDKKTDALYDYYNKQWDAIEQLKERETEKNAKLEQLNKELNKGLLDINKDRLKSTISTANKEIDTVANLYKTIGDYSEDSINAQIKQIERKYKEDGRYAKNRVLTEKAMDAEIFKLRNDAEKKLLDMQLSYLEVVKGKASSEYKEIRELSLQNQANALEQQFNAANGGGKAQQQLSGEQELTQGLRKEYQKRLKDYATYQKGMGNEQGESKALSALQELAQTETEYIKEVQDVRNAVAKTGFDKEQWLTEKRKENRKQDLTDEINFYSSIQGEEDKAYQKKLELIELERTMSIKSVDDIAAANKKANQDQITALTGKIDAEQVWARKAISNYSALIDAAMTCYDEDSKEYKRLQDFKKAAIIAEQVLEIAKNAKIIAGIELRTAATVASSQIENAANASNAVTGAVAGVANQAKGDPYSAFARVAAMIAIMTSVLAIAGIAFSGGSSAEGASVSSYTGKSTILGASDGTASESIDKSYELMQDTYSMEYDELTKLNQSMTELNNYMSGLVTSLIQHISLSSSINPNTGESYNDNKSFQRLMYNAGWGAMGVDPLTASVEMLIATLNMSAEVQGQIHSYLIGLASADPFTTTTHLLLEKFSDNALGKLLGKGIGSIFGGKTETSVTESGVAISAISINDLINGISANIQEYAITHTSVDGGWFHSDKSWDTTYYAEVDDSIKKFFNSMYRGMAVELAAIATNLGTDLQTALNYTFSASNIDIKGLSGEEINDKIEAEFSKILDVAAETLFGDVISQYQKVDEGLFETATRIVTDIASVKNILEKTNQTLPSTTANVIALSESLITMAGDLDTLKEAFQNYYDKFTSDAEKQANLATDLSQVLSTMGMTLPAMREGYKALVESAGLLDTTEGQQKYISLLSLADQADQYYSYLEDAAQEATDMAETRRDMEIQIMEAEGQTAQATAAQREIELAAMDESLRPLQERIWALKDEADAAEASAALLSRITSLQIQYYNAVGDTATATAMDREQTLAGITNETERYWQQQVWAAQDAATAAEEAQQAQEEALSDAKENLQSAFDAEKERLQAIHDARIEFLNTELDVANEAVDTLQGYVDTLQGALDSLDQQLNANEIQTSYASAKSILEQTVTQVNGGNLSAIDNLTDNVLSALTSTEIVKYFGTYEDYKKETVRTYNAISTMKSLADDQLTAQEQQVKGLETLIATTESEFDTQMSAMDAQLNAMLNVNNSVLSVADAIAKYQAAIAQTYATSSTVTSDTTSNTIPPAGLDVIIDAVANHFGNDLAAKGIYATGQIGPDWFGEITGAGVTSAISDTYHNIMQALISGSISQETANAMIDNFMSSLPGYASGGYNPGGWHVTGEEGPELEYTGPSRIYNNRDTKKIFSMDELVAELKEVRKAIQDMNKKNSTDQAKNRDLLDYLERWEAIGMPITRSS